MTSWDAAWEDALTALELDVATAEDLLRHDHAADRPAVPAWTPPSGLGPLPAALADRARALLQRQLDLAERLTEAAALSRRHLRAADAMRAAPPSSPVYLDTPA